MSKHVTSYGISNFVDDDLAAKWDLGRQNFSTLMQEAGVKGDEFSQFMSVFSQNVDDTDAFIRRIELDHDAHEKWLYLASLSSEPIVTSQPKSEVIAFPIANKKSANRLTGSEKGVMNALFVDVHSHIACWWLLSAWRSQQLVNSVWRLDNEFQVIPAATCARSLLETAASVWVEATQFQKAWAGVKNDRATNGPKVEHWKLLNANILRMLWSAKFDKRAGSDRKPSSKLLERTNVLTLLEKLSKVTGEPIQDDYQWLCNAVHPSLGNLLAFSGPALKHKSGAIVLQNICGAPISIEKLHQPRSSGMRETTVEDAIIRSAAFASNVLAQSLNDALRVVDDIGLTSRAAELSSFEYWRNVKRKKTGNFLCPCRSGRNSRDCRHQWGDPAPSITSKF